MDEAHLGAALAYVALNPVRARLADRAADWRWSSVHAQLGAEDGVTVTAPVRMRYPDFAALIAAGEDAELSQRLRRAESVGRPLGSDSFLEPLERTAGDGSAGKRGPRPKRIKCTVTVTPLGLIPAIEQTGRHARAISLVL